MPMPNQVLSAETELRLSSEKVGLETFLRALQIFAFNRSLDAGRMNQLGLEAAWRAVEESCRTVERLQTETQLHDLLGRVGFGTFIRALQMFAGSRAIQASNWSNASLKAAWQAVEEGLQAVEQGQDELDLEIAWEAAFAFPLTVAQEPQSNPDLPPRLFCNMPSPDFAADWDLIAAELTQIAQAHPRNP